MPELHFEGRRLQVSEGQTVAAALTAHGVRVFGRSSRYHRPRGVRCANGTCSCCAMRVDGLPGVRTCVTQVRDGMRVEREHAWPSADFDLLRAAELAGPALHAGAYYRWFRRSPRLWVWAERALAGVRVMRQWAGLVSQTADAAPVLGRVPEVEGFILDCGWVYGFMGAPAAGALLAEAIATGTVPPPLAPFGLERLRTGALIREGSLVVSTGTEG